MVCLTSLGSCLAFVPTFASAGRRRRERNKRLKSNLWHILQLHKGVDLEVIVEKTVRCQIEQVAQIVECKFERVERSVKELQAFSEDLVMELHAQKNETNKGVSDSRIEGYMKEQLACGKDVGSNDRSESDIKEFWGCCDMEYCVDPESCDVTDEHVDGFEDGMEDYMFQRNRRWPFLDNRDDLQYACCSTGSWKLYLGAAPWQASCVGRYVKKENGSAAIELKKR